MLAGAISTVQANTVPITIARALGFPEQLRFCMRLTLTAHVDKALLVKRVALVPIVLHARVHRSIDVKK